MPKEFHHHENLPFQELERTSNTVHIIECPFEQLERHVENLLAFGEFGLNPDGTLAFTKETPYDLCQIVFPDTEHYVRTEPERVWQVVQRILNYNGNGVWEEEDKTRLLRQIVLLDGGRTARFQMAEYAWKARQFFPLVQTIRFSPHETVALWYGLFLKYGENGELDGFVVF